MVAPIRTPAASVDSHEFDRMTDSTGAGFRRKAGAAWRGRDPEHTDALRSASPAATGRGADGSSPGTAALDVRIETQPVAASAARGGRPRGLRGFAIHASRAARAMIRTAPTLDGSVTSAPSRIALRIIVSETPAWCAASGTVKAIGVALVRRDPLLPAMLHSPA